MQDKLFVDGDPGIANASCLSVGKGNGVDGVGVLVVEDKDILIATTGDDGKLSSLIRVGFQDFFVGNEHAAEVMMFRK